MFFRVKWLQPAMKGTSCVRRVRAGLGVVRSVIAGSVCFACFCASQLHGALEALVAKRVVMAGAGWARRSSQCNCWFGVFCVFLRFAVTWCFGSLGCKTRCNGCMNVAWGLFRGGSRSTKCVFSCKVAAAGDERHLVCEAGAGWARRSSQCNCWFGVFCVFLRFAVTWCFRSLGCKTHCNGCMNVYQHTTDSSQRIFQSWNQTHHESSYIKSTTMTASRKWDTCVDLLTWTSQHNDQILNLMQRFT